MPRGNRHFLPGYIWHLTHRCHKRHFLLKFGKDRRRYRRWLFESKKRYNLTILNYMITSNHIHLLVESDTDSSAIPRSMQLAAGRTAQEYNNRKNRKGAFWEDRYHATAVQSDEHLARCMVYINLNMVRAGVVSEPHEWENCGLHEIITHPQRYRCLDLKRLSDLLGLSSPDKVGDWVMDSISQLGETLLKCEPYWSESIAVGTESFVSDVQSQLKANKKGASLREVKKLEEDRFILCERPEACYGAGREAAREESYVEIGDNTLEYITLKDRGNA